MITPNIGSVSTATSATTTSGSTEGDLLAKISGAETAVNTGGAARSTGGTRRSSSALPGAESPSAGQPSRLALSVGQFVSGRQATRNMPSTGSTGATNTWRGAPVLNNFPSATRPVPTFRGGFTIEVDSSTKARGSAGVDTGGTVAQAPRSSASAPVTVSIEQLRKLNPLANVGDHYGAEGWDDMFNRSQYAAPIPGMTGLVTTKPIPIGEGISFPVGTKISNENGIDDKSKPTYQPGRQAGVNFQLPSGKTLKLTPDIDKATGWQMTRITFDDGRFFRIAGSPFFNPNTGVLTGARLVPNTADNPQFVLRESLVGGWLGMSARNDAISGKDAEAALRSALR